MGLFKPWSNVLGFDYIEFMRVPHTDLQPETLINLIESFVTREGTDYGSVERTLDSKIADVMRQLEDGRAFVTYDDASDSVSIVAKDAPIKHAATQPQRDHSESQERRAFDDYSQEAPEFDS